MRLIADCLGTVWLSQSQYGWAASVNIGTRQATQYNFSSVRDAQAWCDEQIARHMAGDEEAGVSLMNDASGWQYDQQSRSYTRQIGHCTAKLWEAEDGRWMTQVISGYRGISGNGYPTMAEAVAWCGPGCTVYRIR
jgi:hypothetical protein